MLSSSMAVAVQEDALAEVLAAEKEEEEDTGGPSEPIDDENTHHWSPRPCTEVG